MTNKNNKMISRMKFIDLFCGTGAFSHVLEKYQYECVLSNDMIEDSKKIYDLNMNPSVFTLKDLNNFDISLEIPEHDILCAGFPCQPFSIAGERKGFKDSRANVFWKIVEILNIRKPKIIILENVKNLITHDKGNTFKNIKENLEKLGYHLKYEILDTCKLTNIPQHRERIYIIGFLDIKTCNKFNFEFDKVKLNPISEYLEKDVPKKYYYTEKLKVYETIKENVLSHINTNTVYQYRRYYVRENKNNCCPTLTANMGSGGHNVPLIKDDFGIRKLTPRECFNLQGFPEDYVLPKISDSKLYKLAGNAVTVPVVGLIVKKLEKIIDH
jgi:DNA (cytosine-5)-methyltransferase 1